ncbi:MAG: DUF4406 domain-containing protein [Spirochaetales bacterium]|nr:DUF4406 domain-containing protein [Spirochaetales bacterium]
MKVYIAGKITGLERDSVVRKFESARNKLVGMGHDVFIPTVLPVYDNVSYTDYMRVCFAMIDICDAIYLLDDWKDSKGACKEYKYAQRKKKLCLNLTEGCL